MSVQCMSFKSTKMDKIVKSSPAITLGILSLYTAGISGTKMNVLSIPMQSNLTVLVMIHRQCHIQNIKVVQHS